MSCKVNSLHNALSIDFCKTLIDVRADRFVKIVIKAANNKQRQLILTRHDKLVPLHQFVIIII